jgi:hypothetical protein
MQTHVTDTDFDTATDDDLGDVDADNADATADEAFDDLYNC